MNKVKSKKVFDIKTLPSILIVVICFGCSGLISILALISQGHTKLAMVVFGILALGSELVKFHFPSTAIASKELGKTMRVMFMLIGLTGVAYSIMFTIAFSKNEVNAVKNDMVANSSEVKTASKKEGTRADITKRLTSELATLEANKTAEIGLW